MLDPVTAAGHNGPMTGQEPPTDAPTIEDLERVDAAEAPTIAEALADLLEAELDAATDAPGGGG
jgi:hypothetical protein